MEMSIYLTAPLALDKICRACLSEAGEMRPLFGTCLDEMFINFASIQVHENDGLPNLMCVRCVLQCSRAYAFKQQCEKSNNILKQYISPEFQNELAKSLIQQQIKVELPEPVSFIEATGQISPELIDVNYIDDGTYKIEVEDNTYIIAATPESCSPDIKMSFDKDEQNSNRKHLCSKCEASFTLKADLKDHMMTHFKELEFVNVSYNDDGAYEIEVEDNIYMTPACEPISSSQKTPKLEFSCSKCDLSFALKVDLQVHTLTHPKELHHVCHVCKKVFPALRILKRHLKIHLTKKPHQCKECDMSFAEKSNLKKHLMKHTGELRNAEGKPHLCSVCGHAFKWASSLSKHMKYHTGHNLFSCKYCSKQYTEARSLITHIKSHTRLRVSEEGNNVM